MARANDRSLTHTVIDSADQSPAKHNRDNCRADSIRQRADTPTMMTTMGRKGEDGLEDLLHQRISGHAQEQRSGEIFLEILPGKDLENRSWVVDPKKRNTCSFLYSCSECSK